ASAAGAATAVTPTAAAAPRLFEPGTIFLRPRAAAPAPATAPAARPVLTPRAPAITAVPAVPAVPAPAPAPAAPDNPPPRVAMLATKPGGSRTDLIFQAVDGTTSSAPVASFAHLADTSVLGAVVPHTRNVLVIAGTERRKDPAFGSSLLLVAEKEDTKTVIDRVYHGTRPLMLDDGRAFVQRGVEGPEPSEADVEAGRIRVDHLTIEEIKLDGSASRVVSEYDGYIAFLAGSLRDEIFVYRVGEDGADIIGVDADTGKERTIVRPLTPYARAFSVDAQEESLLFTNIDTDNPGQWEAVRLDVKPPPPAAPVVSPKGRVAVRGKMTLIERANH